MQDDVGTRECTHISDEYMHMNINMSINMLVEGAQKKDIIIGPSGLWSKYQRDEEQEE